MKKVITGALGVVGCVAVLFAASEILGQEPKEKLDRWEYTVMRHSPHIREGGSDLKRLQALGKDGWEVASSYPARGEIVVTILKRRR